jgi:glycosyltransferase involved in cell wall biosynthesis
MRITLILPGAARVPVGGAKIVYEYANGLVRRGHSVVVVHPAMLLKDTPARARLGCLLRYLVRRLNGSHEPRSWLVVDPRVRLLWVPSLHARYVPDADAVVATAWQTAEWVVDYPPSKGSQIYFIQGLETWAGSDERVMATWRLPMRKIVIAQWLRQIAASMGQDAECIPNGLDFEAFGVDVSPADRRSPRVLMLYHESPWKGASDGLEALGKVKQGIPAMEASLFGVPPAPRGLPAWVRYYRTPSTSLLRQLYNEAAVFTSASRTEGWGLTASEALVCGCAIAVTDIGGHREFAVHGETALLSPVKDPNALACNISKLLQNDDLRVRLARAGHALIQRFTWERSVSAFEQVVSEAALHPTGTP